MLGVDWIYLGLRCEQLGSCEQDVEHGSSITLGDRAGWEFDYIMEVYKWYMWNGGNTTPEWGTAALSICIVC
jgi:hypothetical protein